MPVGTGACCQVKEVHVSKASVGGAWEDMLVFLRGHHSLVLPIGLAFFALPTLVVSWAMPVPNPADPAGSPPAGPWVAWLLPLFVAYLIGSVAISALALRANLSVREGVQAGVRALRTGLSIIGLLIAGVVLVTVVIALAGAVFVLGGVPTGSIMSLMMAVLFTLMLWLLARSLPIWALIADRDPGPVKAIRESFAITRGNTWKILLVTVMFVAVASILGAAVRFTFGSLFLIAGRAAGNQSLGDFLILLLNAVIGGVLTTCWTLFAAMLYRRLAASKGM